MRWSRLVLIAVLCCGVAAGWFVLRSRRERQDGAAIDHAARELEAGRPGSARAILEKLIEHRGEDGQVLLLLGQCEEARGQMTAALTAWERFPKSSPSYVPATVRRAHVLTDQGRFSDAERLLQRLASAGAKPLDAGLRQTLELLYRIEGRIREVRPLIVASWEGADDPSNVLRRLYLLDHFAYPATFIKDSLARGAPDDDRVLLGRANHAIVSGRFEEASKWVSLCLERRPDNASWLAALDLGVARDDPDFAWDAAKHLSTAALTEVERLRLEAWFASRRKNDQLQSKALTTIADLEPGNTAVLDQLAERAQAAQDSGQAEAYRTRKAEANANLSRYKVLLDSDAATRVRAAGELVELATALGRRVEARGWELILNGKARSEPLLAANSQARNEGKSSAMLSESLAAVKPAGEKRPGRSEQAGEIVTRFRDDAEAAGLSFVYDNGHTGKFPPPPESMGGGVGLFDYDGDGWMDVYLVQGGPFPEGQSSSQDGDRLFRNLGNGKFEDVTVRAGLAGLARGYGHGVTVGDYDNDGHPDLFITRWRSYALYRNKGDGTFEDATQRAGLGGDRDWPTSAAFGDLDNDGDLDLYVCHYLDYDEKNPTRCIHPETALRRGCNPLDFKALPDHVFRNDKGRFVDVTKAAGMDERSGRGLGVVIVDLDGDGRVDLYVANDMSANFLYRNLGGFRFEEVGLPSGAASSADGGYKAGMGIACGDLDGDGRIDLGVTNYYGESTTFYNNLGAGVFADHTKAVGLEAPTRLLLGFGLAFADFDNDGRLDVLSANGHVVDERPRIPLKMPLQLLQWGENHKLRDVSHRAGAPFGPEHLGRGFAVADLDRDGLLDAVVVCQNEPVVYLHNQTDRKAGDTGHFLTIRLEGTASNRDGVGATVTVRAGNRKWASARFGGGNYQSADGPLLHFGLGTAHRVDELRVDWPSGKTATYRDLPADSGCHLIEGDSLPRTLSGYPR